MVEELNIETGYRPRPGQRELHLKLKRFNVLNAHRRFGKACPLDTLIPTPDRGMVKLGDVHKGDYVFGHNGAPVEVVEESEVIVTNTWVVTLDNGSQVKCCGDHQWHVEPALSKVYKRQSWCNEMVVTTKQLHELIQQKDSYFIPLPKGPVQYDDVDLPIDPYVFGLWIGDGTGATFELTNPDIEIQDRFCREVSRLGDVPRKSPGRVCLTYRASGKRIKANVALKSLGVFKNKHLPDLYKTAGIEQRWALLAGLMDTDGFAPLRKGIRGSSSSLKYYVNNNKRLVDDVVELLHSLAIKASVYSNFRRGATEYCIQFSSPTNPFLLADKKRERFEARTLRSARYKVVSVEQTQEPCEMKCLRVLDPFSVFLVTDKYIPTHNSVFSVNAMLDYLLRCDRHNPSGVYVAMNYASAKRIVWDYVKQFTENFPGVKTNESDLLITIPRLWRGDKVKIQLLGSERYDSIRGIYIDFCVQDEYAFCMPDSWNKIIRPALSDRNGSAILISTPNGRNHFYDLYGRAERAMASGKDWFAETIRASESGVLSQQELNEIRESIGEEAYQQEFECSFFAQVKGAYYKDQLDLLKTKKQIRDFPIDVSVEVHVAFDLGIGDSTAMWFFQLVGKEVQIIDCYEDSGKGLPDYVKIIRDKPYVIGEIILPHDANARELGTGMSRVETLRKLGMNRLKILPRQSIEDGINAVRVLLPRCYFHETNCMRGLECLYNYHKEFNDKMQVYINKPVHDWSSHMSDAFRYLALSITQLESRARYNSSSLPRVSTSTYDIFSA